MFQSQLTCSKCGYSTCRFTNGYIPATDLVDAVFQNSKTFEIRVVSLNDIRAATGVRNPSEEQIDSAVADCCSEIQSPLEQRIDVWETPNQFEPLCCPECKRTSIELKVLSII